MIRDRRLGARLASSPGALGTKIAIRRKAIELVGRARVLDLFCGDAGSGSMAAEVWKPEAESWLGVDLKPTAEIGARLVGDATEWAARLDLAAFNVFDADAYGSPFDALEVVAGRRRLVRGETIALVMTDGGGFPRRWRRLTPAEARLLAPAGLPTFVAPDQTDRNNHLALLDGLARRVGGREIYRYSATMNGSGRGRHGGFNVSYAIQAFRLDE